MMKAAQGPGTNSGMPLGGGGPNPGQHSPNQMHSGKFSPLSIQIRIFKIIVKHI